MPLLRVTYQQGTLTEAQKERLAEEFTHAILVAEIGNDNPRARSVAYVVFQQTPVGEWFTAGKRELDPIKGGRLILDVIYPVGAADQAAKSRLHTDLSEIIGRVLEVDVTFPNRPGDWFLIHEISEGNWGISTRTVGVETIHAFTQGSPERVPYFKGLLAAQARARAAHGYPAGAPGTGAAV